MNINTLDTLAQVQKLQEASISTIRIFHPNNIEETERYFVIDGAWQPALGQLTDHTIVGRDITRLLQNKTLGISVREDSIVEYNGLNQILNTALEKVKPHRISFSKDFSFEVYLGGA